MEVNSVTKAQLKFSDYKKVPVLVAESENGEEFVVGFGFFFLHLPSFITDVSEMHSNEGILYFL